MLEGPFVVCLHCFFCIALVHLSPKAGLHSWRGKRHWILHGFPPNRAFQESAREPEQGLKQPARRRSCPAWQVSLSRPASRRGLLRTSSWGEGGSSGQVWFPGPHSDISAPAGVHGARPPAEAGTGSSPSGSPGWKLWAVSAASVGHQSLPDIH